MGSTVSILKKSLAALSVGGVVLGALLVGTAAHAGGASKSYEARQGGPGTIDISALDADVIVRSASYSDRIVVKVSAKDGGAYELSGIIPAGTATFQDVRERGHDYAYMVKAVDQSENESMPSNGASLRAPLYPPIGEDF